MSSSIDYITCPKCGSTGAYREQDNKTCEVTFGCPNCNWNGEAVENDEIFEPKKTKKERASVHLPGMWGTSFRFWSSKSLLPIRLLTYQEMGTWIMIIINPVLR